jgi:hypothetical protein
MLTYSTVQRGELVVVCHLVRVLYQVSAVAHATMNLKLI